MLIAGALFSSPGNAQSPYASPADLVRRTVQNEVLQNTDPTARFMFKDQRKTAHTWQTKLIVETREATVGMMVEQDGHPLTPQQQQGEEARLQSYLRNPDELARKRRQEKEDAE